MPKHSHFSFFVLLALAACSRGQFTLQKASYVPNSNANNNNNVNGVTCQAPLTGSLIPRLPFGGSIVENQDVIFEVTVQGGCADTYRILKDGQLVTQIPGTQNSAFIVKRGGYVQSEFNPPGIGRDSLRIEALKSGVATGPSIEVVSLPFQIFSGNPAGSACVAQLSPRTVQVTRTNSGALAFPASTELIVTGMANGMPAPITVQNILIGATPLAVPAHAPSSNLRFPIVSPVEGSMPISVLVRDANNVQSTCSDLFTVVGVSFAVPRVDLKVSRVGEPPVDGPIALEENDDIELHWNALFASNCAINPGNIGAFGDNGKVLVGNITTGTTFTLSCLGANGLTLTDSVSVSVAWVRLNAAYGSLPAKTGTLVSRFAFPVTLTWSSAGATSCALSRNGAPTGQTGVSSTGYGSGPLLVRSVYTITCQVPGGAISDSVEVLPNWHAVDRERCDLHCAALGRTNSQSPEGFRCMSGEAKAASGIGVIPQIHGCRNCNTPSNYTSTASDGRFCYGNGQKKDSDSTDRTTGCYCS